MADENVQTVTINAPENFSYEKGKPISVPITAIDFKSVMPKEFAEKEYAKKYDSFDSLFKAHDGLQGLAGRPYRMPEADAPQEEWDKLFAVMRPGKADEYEFKAPEGLPEELKAPAEFQAKVKQLFHDAGISKRQATILQSGWDALMLGNHKAATATQTAKTEEMNKQFTELMTKTFGDQKDAKIEMARKVMTHVMGKDSPHLALLDKATNEQLVAITAIMNAVQAKYIKEDELPASEAAGGTGVESLKAKADVLRKEEDELLKKNLTTSPRMEAIRKEIAELSQQIAKLSV